MLKYLYVTFGNFSILILAINHLRISFNWIHFEGLLAAISQNYARKYKTSIDLLEFKYEIQNSQQSGEVNVDELFATLDGSVVRSRSELEPKRRESHREGDELKDEGVLLCGFFIDGGKWDSASSKLVDSPQRFSPLPHFICRMIKVYTVYSTFLISRRDISCFFLI